MVNRVFCLVGCILEGLWYNKYDKKVRQERWLIVMSMFDYGKKKTGAESIYAYQYTKPELQAGFYPVDNLKEITAYDEPSLSDYGIPVYGEVRYTKPLTQEQCNMYEFLEVITPNVVQTSQPNASVVQTEPSYDYDDYYEDDDTPFVETQKGVASVPDEKPKAEPAVEMVVLDNVKANRLFSSKNPDYKVMSFRDGRSENGYANFVVQTKNITKNPNGTYQVALGAAGTTQNISVVKNGKSEFIKTPVEAIKEQFEQTLVSAGRKKESSKNAFLNFVDTKFVRATKNPDFKVVSVPYTGSENGYVKVTVASANIFDSKVNGKTVANHVNVNLGPADGVMPVAVKKNGAFTQELMSVEKLSGLQKQAVESWKKYSSQKSAEISQAASQQSTDVVYE